MKIYYYDGDQVVCDEELYLLVCSKSNLPPMYYNGDEYRFFEGMLWRKQIVHAVQPAVKL